MLHVNHLNTRCVLFFNEFLAINSLNQLISLRLNCHVMQVTVVVCFERVHEHESGKIVAL